MLTFLNAYLLPALGLAALPILIHLLTRHKVRDQRFSDLRFLEEIHRRRMRRIKLRQWLLLILRTLAILFVIGAFTRPAIRGVDWGGISGHEQTAIAILVDNSYSTGAIRGSADIFTHEKAIANKILSILEEGDVAAVGVFNESTRWLTQKPSRFFTNLSAMLDTVSTSDLSTNTYQAVEKALNMLEDYKTLHKEIYIITDNTALGWRKGIAPIPANTFVSVIALPSDRTENRTIADITFPPQLLEVAKPFELAVSIKNNKRKAVQGIVSSLIIDGRKTSQAVLDIPAGAQVVSNLSGQTNETGFHWGYAECSEDNLPTDNRKYLTFRIPKALDILIMGESYERKFIRLALIPGDESIFFNVSERNEASLGQELFDKYDVAILIDPQSISDAAIQRLRTFVSNGGGLFIFPGPKAAQSPGAYQKVIRRFGDISVTSVIGDTTQVAQLGWGKSDFTHPVLAVFAETKLPEAKFNRVVQFNVRDGRIFLRFENDMPALAELPLGKGRIIIGGFSTNLRWGNIAISGFFVPMVHRICQYLAADVAYFDAGLKVGGKAARTLQEYSGTGKLQVLYPGGGGTFVMPRFVGGKAMVFIDYLPRAGIYSIISEDDTLDMFSANLDPMEGDLTPLDDAVRKKIPARWLDPDIDISSQVLSARYGIELWRPLLLLALILLAVEMIIETRWRRKRKKKVKESS